MRVCFPARVSSDRFFPAKASDSAAVVWGILRSRGFGRDELIYRDLSWNKRQFLGGWGAILAFLQGVRVAQVQFAQIHAHLKPNIYHLKMIVIHV